MLPCMTKGALQGPEGVRLSCVVPVGSTRNHRYPYKGGRFDCRKGGGNMIKEAKTEVRQPQAKGCQRTPGAGRGKGQILPSNLQKEWQLHGCPDSSPVRLVLDF